MANDKLSDLIPDVDDELAKPDTHNYTIEINPAENPKAGEARMFTLH